MAKDFVHKVRTAPSENSFYGRISKNMDIDNALETLKEKRIEFTEAMWLIGRMASGAGHANAFQQLQTYRKCTPKMVEAFNVAFALADYFAEQIEILEKKTIANANKRWTPEEEEEVIEMICDGCSELEISIKMGRTIGAIHSKVSNLVGLSKPRKIEGDFVGIVGGQDFDGKIKGVIQKPKEE